MMALRMAGLLMPEVDPAAEPAPPPPVSEETALASMATSAFAFWAITAGLATDPEPRFQPPLLNFFFLTLSYLIN